MSSRRLATVLLSAFLAVLWSALVACGEGAKGTPAAAARAVTHAESQDSLMQDSLMVDWADGGCDEVRELPDLAELTTEVVTRRLGEPMQQESFRMGERPDEFHIALQNTYPLNERDNADVEVMEWTWETGDCRLTVWFHQVEASWQSLSNLRWHRDTEF